MYWFFLPFLELDRALDEHLCTGSVSSVGWPLSGHRGGMLIYWPREAIHGRCGSTDFFAHQFCERAWARLAGAGRQAPADVRSQPINMQSLCGALSVCTVTKATFVKPSF